MDVFSHGLWAAALAKIFNLKQEKVKINAWSAAFWGAFPDVFAFAPVFIWLGYQFFFGNFDFGQLGGPDGMEPSQPDTLPIFRLTHFLYSLSHSLFIFAVVFLIIWIIWRRPRYSMFGWLLHILIDIPTHNYEFYPTPFLWPFSEWKFNGFAWADPWFMLVNFSALLTVYILVRRRARRKMALGKKAVA
jgi:hypothetical protein